MPTYHYKCTKCEHQFAEMQRIVDDPLSDCPKCKEENTLEKIIGTPPFVLKGRGWSYNH